MTVSPAASDSDDNNSIDLPSTPPCLQRLRVSTRRAPPPEDDIDEYSLRREGILSESSPPAVPAAAAAPAASAAPALQRIIGLAPVGPSARMGIPTDVSEDGLVYSESEVFDMIIESATTTPASEEACGRCDRQHFPLHEGEAPVASSLYGAEEMSATSDQGTHHHSAQHQAAATSHRDKGTIRLGEGETVVHSSSGAGDNLDAGMVIPAGFKRSVTRPRQHVRRRVEKPQVNTGGTPRKASARRQPRVTNPSSQQGKYNHDMRAATPVVMPPRNNENAPTATTGPGAEVKLAAATASIASTTRREPVTHEPVATAAGNAPESRDEMSTSICEIGYRSVLNAEETSAAAWRRLPQGGVSQDGSLNSRTEECPRREGSPELNERRSRHAKRTSITAAEERTPGEVMSVHVRDKTRSAAPNIDENKRNTLRREAPNPSSGAMSFNSEGTLNTSERGRTTIDCNMQAPMSHQYGSSNDDTLHSVVDTIRSDEDSNADVSPPPPLPDGGTKSGRQIARPPSPPFLPSGNSATESHLPLRHRDAIQGRRDKGRSSLLEPEAPVKTAAKREKTQRTRLERYRATGFVERQELERIAAGHRRQELAREEEEAKCQLSSGGRYMNRSSRAILARSRSSPPCGGGGRSSSSSPHGAGGRGQGPSVFERLARHASDNHSMGNYYGYDAGTWERETSIDGGEEGRAGGRGRQPFTPMIDRRSSLIASRMPRRNEDGHGCLQQRLYRDGEEQVRRRERRVQLADQAVREKAVSCHVNPGSERVLARRSRSRVIRFRSKIVEVLKVVDPNRTGWLSFAGLERVLDMCGMLPDQAPPEVCDDVLLGVWKELSEERSSCGGGNNDSSDGGVGFDQDGSGTGCGVPADSLFALLTGAVSRSYNHELANSIDGNGPSYSCAHTQKTGTKSFSVRSASRRVWGIEEEARRGVKAPEFDAPTATPQCNEQFKDLCQELSDILEANRRYRASVKQEEERQTMRNSDVAMLQRPKTPGLASGGGAPSAATPAQMAATSSRFEEQARARERKIELLRKAEETRKDAAHPFEPTMATAGTLGAPALRRPAAVTGAGKRSSVSPVGRGDPGGDRHEIVAEDQHTARTDRRTTEQREVDENCTFQPRLYQPLPLSPPRYPTRKNTHNSSSGAGSPEKHPVDSPGGTSIAAVDRATTSWNTQVDRLKTGRMNRLRRLEEKQAIENRNEPLPPSVQQLFIDAGIEMHPRENYNSSGRFITTAGNSSGSADKRTNGNGSGNTNANATNNQGSSNTQRPLPGRRSSSASSSSRLEGRLRARNLMKQKRNEEQARKSAEENAQLLKRKRVLARACKRSSAVVRLEAALAAREAERGRPGWGDPPVLIAEVEFVRQNWWALLPLWADTCPREAVDELTRQQHGVSVSTVARELETSFADEIERAREQATSLGLGLEQKTESWASGVGKAGRSGKNHRAVPTVVLQVDVENDTSVGCV